MTTAAVSNIGVNGESMETLISEIWPIVTLSLIVSGSAVVISCVLGMPLGASIGLSPMPGRLILKVLVFGGYGSATRRRWIGALPAAFTFGPAWRMAMAVHSQRHDPCTGDP